MDQRKLPTAITESDYDIINHPRTYMYFEQPVLYPFGYGLSYTQFEYSSLKLSSDKINNNGELEVQFSTKNSGKMNGDEIA
jgi:beta-glucosidase